MANNIAIKRSCGVCQGDGFVSENATDPEGNPLPGIPETCSACKGTGWDTPFFIDEILATKLEDMQNAINDVLDKCNDIIEKLNE